MMQARKYAAFLAGALALVITIPAQAGSINKSISIGDGEEADGQSSVNGSISIGAGAIINGSVGRGAVFAESTSGDVTARGLAGEFEAESVSGDLNIELRTAPRTRLNTISGDIDAVLLLVGDARLDVESISGDVDLRFTEPVNAAFDVESHSGKIDNCFGPKPERKSKYAPGTELRFTEGTGTSRVRIDTLSGEIEFCTR